MSKEVAYPGTPDVINGNGAVAYVMKQVCGGVIGYPITPSTEISEIFEAGRAEGQLNVWGKHPFFVEAEGEHSAQSGALAATLAGGNFVSNASSAQGVLYGLESHYVTAGKTIGGFVLQVAARVVTRHSLNVMAGHDDIYALLPAGYTILFGSNPQEAADLAAIAYRTTSLSMVPVANAMDGFATSHVMSEVLLPEPELLKTYLGDPAGRIPCPTVAQEVLFGAKGRVDYLGHWLDSHAAQIDPAQLAALRSHLAEHSDDVEQDNAAAGATVTGAHLPESLRGAWRRAWKGAWQKGTRQTVPAIIDPNNPGLAGGVQNQPDFQAGAADHRTHFLSEVPGLLRQAMREYADLTGREYSPVVRYGAQDADIVLVGLGSITDDARALLPYLEKQGVKLAVVSVKVLQPFPGEELVAALKGAKQVTVLERSENLQLTRATQEALFKAGASADDVTLTTAIFGLGSHDVQPRDLIAVVQNMIDGPKAPLVYVGSQFFVKNPATKSLAALQDTMRAAYPETEKMALETKPNPEGLLPPDALRIRFHSVGGYGTVATGKLLTDMLSSMLQLHSKSSPKYGSEKSGAATNFYITLSPETVLFTNATLEDVEVVVSPDHKVFEHDRPLHGLVKGGTFILQTDKSAVEAWQSLPQYARQLIRDKQIRFLVIDAFAVARRHAPNPALETRMMGVAFIGAMFAHVDRISRGADPAKVHELVRHELAKKFGSKGDTVVEANMAVVTDGIAAAQVVDYSQPEFADPEGAAATKMAALTPRLVPSNGTAPSRIFDPDYFDDILGRSFREGTVGQAPVMPGTGSFLPSGSGAAKNKGIFRRDVPVFDFTKCTACLECAIACPDSAIPNQAHEISDLIARAIRTAGLPAEATAYVLGFVSAWADAVRATLLADTKAKDFTHVVQATAGGVVPALAPEHLRAIVAEVAAFPVSRIRPIFDSMEKNAPGTGAMYSVVIDPWKCSGCLECVSVCGPGALSPVTQTDQVLDTMTATYERLTELPNTPARFTAEAARPGGDAKRVLMDHDNYYALVGGHGACKGCGEVTATHLVTALSQAVGEDKRQRHIAELESLIYRLTSKIAGVEAERAARLRGLVETLEASLWELESGPTGHGPAAAVVVNSTGCSSVYSSTFPYTPFVQPWLNSLFQDAQPSAVGLFEGVASKYIAEVRARRAAELELTDDYDPKRDGKALSTLDWRHLTSDELTGLPFFWTISGDGAAYDIGFGAMSRVVTSQAPIKMLLLDTGGYSNTGGQASTASFTGQNADLARYGKAHHGKTEKRKELPILIALHPYAFVASVSAAMHSHFLAAASRMLAFNHGTALMQAYTPCDFEQGFADDLANERANLAVRSRMAPLFVHDPTAGSTLPERLSLEGNPELDKPWATLNLKHIDESGATAVTRMPLTPAEFAYGEVRFAKHFRVMGADAVGATPIAEYVELAEDARVGKTPYIVVTNGSGHLVKMAVSHEIVELVEDRQANWQLLRFLAGRDSALKAKDAAAALKALQSELASAQASREQGIDDIAHALAQLATTGSTSVSLAGFGAGSSATDGGAGLAALSAGGPASAGPPHLSSDRSDPAAMGVPPAGRGDVVGSGISAAVSGSASAASVPGAASASAASVPGLGAKPAGAPIWLAEQDVAKCTDCATCYQELPDIFESTVMVVDGEAKNVSRMKPGALDGLTVTPELAGVMQRVKDTCDAEIIQ
ncbi:MAG: 2-oxoacid:acceptor oxidoreductase family protein [Propionibacteriaceae bacterium]|jgi:pyruvate-ferredoxin/flavodoxin oxidoreductase|nr:2-oxoacid:acceptor oxidoreductase family protein [Propionibacteriaceae bacterium]